MMKSPNLNGGTFSAMDELKRSLTVLIVSIPALSFAGIFFYKILALGSVLVGKRYISAKLVAVSLLFICCVVFSSLFSWQGHENIWISLTHLASDFRVTDVWGTKTPPLKSTELFAAILNIILGFIVASNLFTDKKNVEKCFLYAVRLTSILCLLFFIFSGAYDVVRESFLSTITYSEGARFKVLPFWYDQQVPRVHGFFSEPAFIFSFLFIWVGCLGVMEGRTLELLFHGILITLLSQSYNGVIFCAFILLCRIMNVKYALLIFLGFLGVLPLFLSLSNFGGSLSFRFMLPDFSLNPFGYSYLYAMSLNPLINIVVKMGFIGIIFLGLAFVFLPVRYLLAFLVASAGYPNFFDFVFLFPFFLCCLAFWNGNVDEATKREMYFWRLKKL